ncbi:hypothetical protein DVA86_10365 [Streptomyces armeniacus]|uniref:Uncharacterized protein n=1 Tax=Streptomyces armeniacus TaxID=83291 RepID=A0A345XMX6_9ACTN|nr:hypothetical protein [Streptomyces armeniacus]AXK32992.1 hypothetical protein DVA86_10365 [Streptomyces armeniacus]
MPSVESYASGPGGLDTITDCCLAARRSGRFTPGQWSALDAALDRVEHSHQRWKATHHALAARMIGPASGSDYTEGVPYLRQCLDNRLFWRLGELSSRTGG